MLGGDTQRSGIIDILDGNQLTRSNALLDPVRQSQISIVLAALVTRNGPNIGCCQGAGLAGLQN